MSGTEARVVVHAESGALSGELLHEAVADLRRVPHVSAVSPPVVSTDAATALFSLQYDVPVTQFKGEEAVDALSEATAPLREAGLQVEYGGQVPENINEPSGVAEAVGVTSALIILLVAFGSVVAAGLPLAIAFAGLAVGTSAVLLLAAVTSVSPTSPTLATMVGLGVGIDYALFIVTRHREELATGADAAEAAGRANATAGQSVVFAGGTVIVAICGLAFCGLPILATMGFATALVVAAVVAAAVTLLPALLGLAGERVFSRSARRAARRRHSRGRRKREPATARWARRIGHRPLPWALASVVLLLALAAPVLTMRLGATDAGGEPTSNTVRRAYDLISDAFGPGTNAPLLVAVDLRRVPEARLAEMTDELRRTPGVAAVSPPAVAPGGDAAAVTVTPTTGPNEERTAALVRHLRDDVLPAGADATGMTAAWLDMSDLLGDRLPLVISVVITTSFVLLVLVFRSVVVPIKAAVMNLLSIGAAYGVVTALFQWGWGAGLLGLPHEVPVNTFVPVLMFTILFGLSMDYEVFLLSRVREEFLVSGDTRASVVRGLTVTGPVITSAAAIMVLIFLGFALDPSVIVKMMGVGLATAIAVDATIVRMVLVPATMAMLGKANWWLPGWLDRLLPHLDAHGAAVTIPAPRHGDIDDRRPRDRSTPPRQ